MKEITKSKVCSSCGKTKSISKFYKVNSDLFADGRISKCSDCIDRDVDEDDLGQVMELLRMINKPFIRNTWESAKADTQRTVGLYVRWVNSLSHLRNKKYSDGENVTVDKDSDIIDANKIEAIETSEGVEIVYDESLAFKWGAGFTKLETLKLEKYYQDMLNTFTVTAPSDRDILIQLAKMSVIRDKALMSNNIADHTKLSKTISEMMMSAKLRPADRRGQDEQRGIKSFNQIFEEVESKGWVAPPPPVFDEDIVDQMLVSILNYYNRMVGSTVLSEIPEDVKVELETFFNKTDTDVDEEILSKMVLDDEKIKKERKAEALKRGEVYEEDEFI